MWEKKINQEKKSAHRSLTHSVTTGAVQGCSLPYSSPYSGTSHSRGSGRGIPDTIGTQIGSLGHLCSVGHRADAWGWFEDNVPPSPLPSPYSFCQIGTRMFISGLTLKALSWFGWPRGCAVVLSTRWKKIHDAEKSIPWHNCSESCHFNQSICGPIDLQGKRWSFDSPDQQ